MKVHTRTHGALLCLDGRLAEKKKLLSSADFIACGTSWISNTPVSTFITMVCPVPV
jgi:hypothetical protein